MNRVALVQNGKEKLFRKSKKEKHIEKEQMGKELEEKI